MFKVYYQCAEVAEVATLRAIKHLMVSRSYMHVYVVDPVGVGVNYVMSNGRIHKS